MMNEIRAQATLASNERNADRQTRRDAETALKHLCNEVDTLKEEMQHRGAASMPPSPLSLSTIQNIESKPQFSPAKSRPDVAPQVIRFASAPAKEWPGKAQFFQSFPDVQAKPQLQRPAEGTIQNKYFPEAVPRIQVPQPHEQPRPDFSSAPLPNAEPLARWAANAVPLNAPGPSQAVPFAGTSRFATGSASPPMPNRPGPTTPPLPHRGHAGGMLQGLGTSSAPNLGTFGNQTQSGQAGPVSSGPACRHCGSIYMPESNFCKRCGKPRTSETQGNASAPPPVFSFKDVQKPAIVGGPSFGLAPGAFGT
jgi:hypothetical protein